MKTQRGVPDNIHTPLQKEMEFSRGDGGWGGEGGKSL